MYQTTFTVDHKYQPGDKVTCSEFREPKEIASVKLTDCVADMLVYEMTDLTRFRVSWVDRNATLVPARPQPGEVYRWRHGDNPYRRVAFTTATKANFTSGTWVDLNGFNDDWEKIDLGEN